MSIRKLRRRHFAMYGHLVWVESCSSCGNLSHTFNKRQIMSRTPEYRA